MSEQAKEYIKKHHPNPDSLFEGNDRDEFIYKNIIALMDGFADHHHKEELKKISERLENRVDVIRSEPDGIVRETMINNILIDL